MKHVYGPVPSRRLGRSLGVNLTPMKTCTYDCVYCQLGRTTNKTIKRKDYYDPNIIFNQMKSLIDTKNKQNEIDYITFVGEGEPTLCKSIGWFIDKIKQIWEIPVAVDTNGSLLFHKDVRKDLVKADIVMPSLDAGTQDTYWKINRPVKGIEFETIINGMELFSKEFDGQIWLEIMLVKNVNDSKEELIEFRKHIERINPDRVYINVPIRPPSEQWAVPPEDNKMKLAYEILGNVINIIDEEEGEFSVEEYDDPIEAIESIVRRHPMREDQLLHVIDQFDNINMKNVLEHLMERNKITINKYKGTTFFKFKDEVHPKKT